jgi:hypothetical protein
MREGLERKELVTKAHAMNSAGRLRIRSGSSYSPVHLRDLHVLQVGTVNPENSRLAVRQVTRPCKVP